MATYSTTKLSAKGQIVIPAEIRDNLHLEEGHQFVVIGQGDTVILKSISFPKLDELSDLIDEAQKNARAVGLKKSDLAKAMKRVRRSKK